MVCNTRDCWAFGLCPPLGVLKNITFQKLNLVPSLGEELGDSVPEIESGFILR
jgi:hypothetical protein